MGHFARIRNDTVRRLDTMFPGYFPAVKHDHYHDFGYPKTLEFKQFFDMYTRNGVARAGVDKTALKTWQELPFLLEKERDGSEQGGSEETKLEADIRRRFDDLRLWSRLADADRMALVGGYSGALLSLRDGRLWHDPVDRVPGGVDGIAKIIPAWAGQITPADWDADPSSENYGDPVMYEFQESSVDRSKRKHRNFKVHPDRVLIWSSDATVHGRSILEAGYNDLLTLEKISGAGGEGFWKNAKSAPVLEVDPEAKLDQMAKSMGVRPEEMADKMTEQVEAWQQGFDKMLMLQGIKAQTLSIVMPSPEHFFNIALQSFAASIGIPMKILIGMQTGERASTEDAEEWAQTNMSRRTNMVIPNVMMLVNRLERFGVLPERDWHLDWADLTEASMAEKIDRAVKMADANQKMQQSGEWVFLPEEIRAAVDYEPLSDADKYRDEQDDDDSLAAVTPPAAEDQTGDE